MESILCALNKKNYVAGIFCVISKAFDCVNHELLIYRLQFHGVRGVILDWFRSDTFYRKRTVRMNLINTINCSSNWKIMKQGVSQSLLLGPL
jgi:hypothetical protein